MILNRFIVILCMLGLTLSLNAQRSFSDDQTEFFNQANLVIKQVGTEAANKVAFDFQNAWNAKFTTVQKTQIQDIAQAMQKKGYVSNPDFFYFFSYLAYSVTQAGLNQDELSEVLDINEEVVKTMNKESYRNFLLGLNVFMARRFLVRSKSFSSITDGGSFSFKLLEDFTPPDPEEEITYYQQVQEAEPVEEFVPDPEPVNDNTASDPWAQEQATDDWGSNDDWGSDDDWGSSDDDWGSSDDDWGTSGADWANSDSWGTESGNSYAASTPESTKRQEVKAYAEDFVKGLTLRYEHPVVGGPVIDLVNNSMLIVTPYDSFQIKETSGKFLLKSRVYAGTKATINWPQRYKNHLGATVTLEDFHIDPVVSNFWTPNAKLSFPELFSGTVEGYFEFKSPKRKNRRSPSMYPIFISNETGISVKLPDGKMKYTGGVELSGDQLYGTSISKKKGTLEILDGKGNKVVVRAEKFIFRDSAVWTHSGDFVLRHGGDSIFHSGVSMKYDSKERQLLVIRNKKFETEPFASTYFEMNINAQSLKWDMKTDSMHFSVIDGKDLIPVTVESNKYYNDIRFRKLASGYNFHPVATPVYYALKYGINQFHVDELVNQFGMLKKHAIAAMRVIATYGFGEYDEAMGMVKLYDKAFHYYNASARKVDYDNIMIPSTEPNRPNATLSLDSGTLKMRGVGSFYPTSDFEVKVLPKEGNLKVLKGKNIEFDGAVVAGDFRYMGSSFVFDYEGFLINMPEVDSIRIELHQIDESLGGDEHKLALHNEITETAGVLYLDDPSDKSGVKPSGGFPHFTSDKEAVVYFDGKEVLDGAYDKSVRFVIPPFDEDSLAVDNAISFEGRFNSGGIFPTFEETLRIQPDKSLGFVHQMPPEGYNLYGTAAKTYEKIYLSADGIRGKGKIDFFTSTIYSDDIVYYPDSVAAVGTSGFIGAGNVNGASYPEAVLGPYRMHWLPRKDSMYLRNLYEPFKFYNATAELEGEANITSSGVFGSGVMHTRGSVAESSELTFEQYSYSARHAEFEVLTDNPDKPAMAGSDISLEFDLINNTANVRPEKAGVAAISFPYAQMNTSITQAVWDLEDSVVTMSKPPNVPIEDSYFYSTREQLEGLKFSAERADYDFNTKELFIQGIPYIIVADAEITPANGETTILENSELQEFNNATIKIDTLNEYHYLHSADIKILSRNKFVGSAKYSLITGIDTFDIQFNEFNLDDVNIGEKKTQRMTVSHGKVLEKQNLRISPGFFYKGKVKMYAYRKALELDGYVKLDLERPGYNAWVKHEKKDENPNIIIDFDNSYFEDEDPVLAGLHYDLRGEVYGSFVDKRKAPSDEDFFLAKGLLKYDTLDKIYKIEAQAKSIGESYEGHTMIYSDETKDVVFEGKANFFGPYADRVKVFGSVMGTGNLESKEFQIDAMVGLDIFDSEAYMELMGQDLIDIVERLGPPQANDISLELLYKLANVTSDEEAKDYEKSSLKDYIPLVKVSDKLKTALVISGVKMKWSQSHRAWYNTTKIGVSNIFGMDINAKLDGFLEIKKDASNEDVLNLFIQAAPGTWYFISYSSNTLLMYASNTDFNLTVSEKSNYGKAGPNELVVVGGDENETLSFVNSFRENYFGIKEAFNLVYPDDFDIEEDEGFDTIETIDEPNDTSSDEDDGFGF
ncbi:MAG: hypothetical protein ABJ004_04980 [Cyclobacteriaceae bacterium]